MIRARLMGMVMLGCVGCTAADGGRDTGTTCEGCVPTQPGAPSIGGCVMFPANSVLNTTVVGAPVRPESAAWIARMREIAGIAPGPGASSLVWEGSRGGIPVNVGGVLRTLALDGSYGQPIEAFTTVMPVSPRIEGEPSALGAWDKHVLVVEPDTCQLNEHIQYRNDFFRGWLTGASVHWDLSNNDRSIPFVVNAFGAEAAGLPMAPLIFHYDEVAAGEIRHPIRFASSSIRKGTYIWPAHASDGRDDNESAMPMGARLRLKDGTDLSALGPQATVIAKALQTYGAILADSTPDGGGWGLTGEGDERWNDADLATLKSLDANQFEVVDTDSWKVSDGSFEARLP